MTLEVDSSGCRVRQQAYLQWQFRAEHFYPEFWEPDPEFEASSGGRGGSCLIKVDGRKAVLRRYRRGGVVARLLSDQYLWLGQARTRPWQEWDVLERARAEGLPVPEPLAACTCRSLLWYRAALVTAYLDGTEMMTQRLRREHLSRKSWFDLGALFKRMHAVGIRHADLTPDNILMDADDRFYLVDFDMARLMPRLDDWQWQPLYRFQRALDKRHRHQALNFSEDDWQALMDGYQA
jgi:3-deoxy-D-manno-octulosonic acid kinase